MNYIDLITGNRIIDAAFLAWIIAQSMKIIIEWCINKKFNFHRILGSGGMPSSHSAFVVALTTSVFKVCGLHSPEFAISLCFSLVVMFDAANVRRAAGEQAKILNYMMEHWKDTTPDMFGKELKELLGHTPFQVIIGALIGIIVGTLV